MQYNSTRNNSVCVSAARAITQGISKEGGLFVPQSFPPLTAEDILSLVNKSYVERATFVLSKYLSDFTEDEVKACAEAAYSLERFRSPEIAPLRKLNDNAHILELWHGPTCAFKDMALQILPHLMRGSAEKTSDGKEIVILVATSGDTGKAALEGFRDADHTRILVFYPEDGVSPMQKLQMVTQEGENVSVCAIRGNFDDAQTGVKTIFTDPAVAAVLEENGMMFSSANSINWGRLVPQIVYYVSAYCDLIKNVTIQNGDAMNVVVPTGNFGNILAAYYAKQMGLPIGKLICASNKNRVLTDFINSGTYDRNRSFYTTSSPSMDILISSNLERLLYELSGRDDKEICAWMNALSSDGVYTVSESVKASMDECFVGGCCDDEQTAKTIREIFDTYGYLCDTHTAVAVHVYNEYVNETGDTTPTVIASTANPYKFSSSVLSALDIDVSQMDEFDKVESLNNTTNEPVPAPLSGLRGREPRFTGVCNKEDMQQVVYDLLGIQ